MEATEVEIRPYVDLLDDFLSAWNKHDAGVDTGPTPSGGYPKEPRENFST